MLQKINFDKNFKYQFLSTAKWLGYANQIIIYGELIAYFKFADLLIENMPRTSDCVIDLTEDDESSSSLPLFSMNAINEAKIAKFSANSDVASDDDEIIIENIIYRDKPGNKPGDKPLTFEKQPQKQQSVLKVN